jgi:L-ascorbate metabolism protein UlaG (beta-lactamase superfamily)
MSTALKIDLGFALTWLGHSAFHLLTPGGKHVLFDPWLDNPRAPKGVAIEKVDVILVTHGHGDHVGATVALAQTHGCPVVCGYELSLILEEQGVKTAIGMGKGGTVDVAGMRVTATHAIHSSSADVAGARVYAGEPLGFVVKLENDAAIYFAGDTGPMSDMAVIGELYEPNVSVLPIGDLYTMGPREAAWAAAKLGSAFVVPMHYGTFAALTGTPDALRSELQARGSTAKVIAPEPGERVE